MLFAGYKVRHFLSTVDYAYFACHVSGGAELTFLHDAAVHSLGALVGYKHMDKLSSS